MTLRRLDPARAPTPEQVAEVEALLGRPASGSFLLAVVDEHGAPIVIRNGPFMVDGRPMPTSYWLVGRDLSRAVGRLEGVGGVRQAEAAVDPEELVAAHVRYALARDAEIPTDHVGPRPSGGVGGTRRGVKCLHTHVAHQLARGGDPVGVWALEQLDLLP